MRIKKVIRNQATGSMDRKFENHDFLQNIDAGEGFKLLKSRNSLAGAIEATPVNILYYFFGYSKCFVGACLRVGPTNVRDVGFSARLVM